MIILFLVLQIHFRLQSFSILLHHIMLSIKSFGNSLSIYQCITCSFNYNIFIFINSLNNRYVSWSQNSLFIYNIVFFYIVTSPDSITTEHLLKKAIVLMSKHVLTRESSIMKTYYVRSTCTLLLLVLLSWQRLCV